MTSECCVHAWGWCVVNSHPWPVTCQLTLHFSRGERVHFIWPLPINMWSQAIYMHVHTLTYMYMHVQCVAGSWWCIVMYPFLGSEYSVCAAASLFRVPSHFLIWNWLDLLFTSLCVSYRYIEWPHSWVWDGRDIYSHKHAQTSLLIQLRAYHLKVSSWH